MISDHYFHPIIYLFLLMLISLGTGEVDTSDQILATISISEKKGLSRSGEYIEYPLQISMESHNTSTPILIVEDRLHWAPNFKRPELEYYTTIAHWVSPGVYDLQKGPYRIKTIRQDLAPDHLTFVPGGSRYIEENAYLVFRISQKDRFENIKYWLDRLHYPLNVDVQYH